MSPSELEKAVRTLPADGRARLVEVPLESLQEAPTAEIEAAWSREIEARIRAYECGELESLSAERVFAEARLLNR